MVRPAAVTIGRRTRRPAAALKSRTKWVCSEPSLVRGCGDVGRRRVEPLGRLAQPLAQDHPFRRHADVFARQLVQVPLASPVPVDDVVHLQDRSIGEDGIHEAVDGGAVDVQLRPTYPPEARCCARSARSWALIGARSLISSIARPSPPASTLEILSCGPRPYLDGGGRTGWTDSFRCLEPLPERPAAKASSTGTMAADGTVLSVDQ
jgi:hypothetical protein